MPLLPHQCSEFLTCRKFNFPAAEAKKAGKIRVGDRYFVNGGERGEREGDGRRVDPKLFGDKNRLLPGLARLGGKQAAAERRGEP